MAARIRPGVPPHLALIVSDRPATAVGFFTTNRVAAAPVQVGRERVAAGLLQAIVVNSGNANAFTGARGLRDARAMTAQVARRLGVPEELVLPSSTGRIGVPLPIERVREGIRAACEVL
ncbi:MAG: bifunctional ornithine acetyltransferase/N-acetylglutamate synthase, partial [Akkermansiaceae bacterium]|nr:bifunctional ornithine acetyltransferase/N-acetylglutamate synthase [Akkermansiaceae bacterium]